MLAMKPAPPVINIFFPVIIHLLLRKKLKPNPVIHADPDGPRACRCFHCSKPTIFFAASPLP